MLTHARRLCAFTGYVDRMMSCRYNFIPTTNLSFFIVLKSIPVIEAKEHNEKSRFAYNEDIMQKAESDPLLRTGPSHNNNNTLTNGQS